MSKRDLFSDPSDQEEGPSSKMRKVDDSDDGGGMGRSGRVRKKSAKVLEMEEFEQAEKSSNVVKKTKTPKVAPVPGHESDGFDGAASSKKSKGATSAVGMLLESTPVSRKMLSSADPSRSIPAELSLRSPPNMMISPIETMSQVHIQQDLKPDISPASSLMSSVLPQVTAVKQEDPKSVIKYLLSSPAAGNTHQISTGLLHTHSHETPEPTLPSKKASKKIKFEDKNTSGSKTKEKKMKIEIMSPSELGPPVSSLPVSEPKGPSLKMKIMSGSNPMTAQVALESSDSVTPKVKKQSKKAKTPVETDDDIKLEIAGVADEEKATKKKKVSKKKEKLIQDAISAAKQMPNLAALVASPHSQGIGLETPSPPVKQTKKKKTASSPSSAKKDASISNSLVMDFDDADMEEDEAGESTLVIAETEKKKKKQVGKKKAQKEKDESTTSPKEEKVKKIPKRAPTAYMLFCNTHRPAIVTENPGIAFASISRKLGELWQTQSNKQKLQWRRKAQRRMKKSNLISTGKVGKDSQGGPPASSTAAASSQMVTSFTSTNQKLALMLQKSKPVALEEGPLSPTKVGIDLGMESDENEESNNFSIEPLDVAAHLKLLGESLSIIGMRLQEHKGMIAVQGSLSVLLDSLLCACGPLLCLTQQVPGMDGCSPLVHAQTLDSIAYVMPGL